MGYIENKFEKNFIISTVDYVFNWARKSALWPLTFGLACCAIEMIASTTSRFDMARFCLGTCLMRLCRYQEAAEQFRVAATVDPTYLQAVQAQASALEAAREVEAAARLRQERPGP